MLGSSLRVAGAARCAQALILLLSACSTSMNRPSDPNGPLSSSEGIVIGSALVRVGKMQNAGPVHLAPSFMVSAQKIQYSLEGGAFRDTQSVIEHPIDLERDFSLDITPGEEKVFVMKLSAGPHDFHHLVPRGYEEASAALGVRFTVTPGGVNYIGRILFDVPERAPLGKGLSKGSYSLPFTLRVEDAQDATMASVVSTHGAMTRPVVKNLMEP
jgi:hypothetical protein